MPEHSRGAAQPGYAHLKRIVLYGRPSSGKTCFLAALAMARLPHPLGYSCIWVCDSQSVPTPSGRRDEWDTHDPKVALYLGREWLQKAIDAIQAGDVPRATPNDVTPYRLLFDLTMPDGRIFRLEMIDYSGELVDPNLAEDDLAKQLIDHLQEADGVLVLAEAPKSHAPEDEAEVHLVGQHRELLILQQALMLVAEKRRKSRVEPVPVGMLLNKWDRYTSTERYDEGAIGIEKEIFMKRKPPVPQRILFNVLKAVAGTTGEESFAEVFAVSAFGRTKTVARRMEDGTERRLEIPQKLTPLQSYGLEDPLIWVCEKASGLEMRGLEADVASLAPWKVWQIASRRALEVRGRLRALRRRVPGHLPQARMLDAMAARCVSSFGKQCAVAAAVAASLLVACSEFLVYHYDNWQYTRVFPALQAAKDGSSPAEWAEQWRDAGKFLASYSKPSYLRLASHSYLLSAEAAEQHLAQLQPKLGEAERILAGRQEFDVRVAGLIDHSKASEDVGQVESLRVQLAGLDVPAEYPGGGTKKAKALAEIDARVEELRVKKSGEDVVREYNDFMKSRNLAGAAELLRNKHRQAPTVVASLRSDFQRQCDGVLVAEVRSRCEGGHWGRALEALDEVEGSTAAVELTGASGRIRRDELRRRVETYRGERVYGNWYNDRENLVKFEDLMQYGSADDRARAVAWRAYRDFEMSRQSWDVTIEEIYQPDYGGSFGVNTRTTCRRDGTSLINATWKFDRKPETARPNATGSTSARYDEAISLDLRYETLDFNFGNTSGEATWRGSLRDLVQGVTVKIVTAAYGDADVKLRAKLRSGSMPTNPDLRTPQGGSF